MGMSMPLAAESLADPITDHERTDHDGLGPLPVLGGEVTAPSGASVELWLAEGGDRILVRDPAGGLVVDVVLGDGAPRVRWGR